LKIRNRYLTKLIALAAVALVRVLFKTCRIEIATEVPGCCPYEDTGDRRFLYCVWHDDILMTVFCGRPKKMAGLVSPHQDGSYLADAMQRVGITSVRGSSKRGASRAMRELLDRVRDLHVAITPDGPRGPRRQMKTGIIFLASRSGRVIIPTAYACRRAWRIRGNWTDMQLPMPFTRVHARGGPAFVVPADLDREQLELYAQRLQAEMERQEAIAIAAVSQPSKEHASADDTRDRLAA
jgi:lysophospholipid acyltransferase (LPLAT)-like uncharacterized protein